MRGRLEKMSGAEFDRAYVQGQVADHQKTAQLLEYEIGSGQDVELKSFASEILPIVLQHLRIAQEIQAELTGKAL
jgi:putative membrane protein